MAAAHLTHHFPDAQLVTVLDPGIPTIGVRGNHARASNLADELVRVPYEEMQREIRVTLKRGVRFENWLVEAPNRQIHDCSSKYPCLSGGTT
jgi:hypothetical protein